MQAQSPLIRMAEGRVSSEVICATAWLKVSQGLIFETCWKALSPATWVSERRMKRWGSRGFSSARRWRGRRREAPAAREVVRKRRREMGGSVIGMREFLQRDA